MSSESDFIHDLICPPRLYLTDQIRQHFGKHWCGPDKMPHGQDVLIAKYKKVGGDGQAAEVWACFMPADFYTVKALAGTNSVKEPQAGFALQTRSGAADLAARLAEEISQGGLGLTDPTRNAAVETD